MPVNPVSSIFFTEIYANSPKDLTIILPLFFFRQWHAWYRDCHEEILRNNVDVMYFTTISTENVQHVTFSSNLIFLILAGIATTSKHSINLYQTVSINLFHSNKLTWFTTLFPASSWFDFNFLIRLVHFLKNVIVCRIHFALNSLWWFSTFNCHYAFDAKMSYFNCFLILLIYWLFILKWNLIHSLYSLHVPSIANVA